MSVGVGQAEGIHRGVGVPNDAPERLLCILEVGLPLLPIPIELGKLFELGTFVREALLCEEGVGCNGNKPRVRYSEAGLPGLPLSFLAAGNELWDSWVFNPPG